MSKKKRFLSLLMALLALFWLLILREKINMIENKKRYDQLSVDEQIVEKLKIEILPNLDDISKLNNKDDIKFLSNLLSDIKLRKNLKKFI